MHRVFRTFIDNLSQSSDTADLCNALAQVSVAFDLRCFAYLSLPDQPDAAATLISTYPKDWTSLYLRSHYERLDPVIEQALNDPEPFEWGPGFGMAAKSNTQRELLEAAADFGIRYGFTVPIHDGRGHTAAVTFAVDERRPSFRRCVEKKSTVLQLLAMLFHAHANRIVSDSRVIAGVRLSPRQLECLEWAAHGKSASDIGCILGISTRTAAFHLEGAKAKLGVRTTCQAVALFAASKRIIQ